MDAKRARVMHRFFRLAKASIDGFNLTGGRISTYGELLDAWDACDREGVSEPECDALVAMAGDVFVPAWAQERYGRRQQ